MASKKVVQRAVGAVALAAIVLGAAGFAGSRATPRATTASPFHSSAHVLQYPNFDSGSWPKTFDPDNVTDSQSIMVTYMLYGNLVKFDSKNNVIPDLAQRWTISPDRMTYTFYLRNTSFSDGHRITADDVIYSIDRALNPKVYNGTPSPVAGLYLAPISGAASYKGKGDVSGLKKISTYTVQIHLDKPISYFLQTLSYPTADILEKGKTPLNGLTTKNPMSNQFSSGAFVISAYRYKSTLTFKPNPGYYNAKNMKLTEVDMPFVPQDQTMYQGYESGQYAMTVVPVNRLAQARTQSDFHTSPILAIDYITYNFAKAPFNNKNLRLAMTWAINRDRINKDVLKGSDVTIYSVVPQGIPGYDAHGKGKVPGYDLTKAKMYLALAKKQMGKNFPSSLTIRYQGGSDAVTKEYTELQYEWKQAGLNVHVESIDFNGWLGLVAKPSPSLTYKGGDPWVENLWIDDYPDAQDFTTNLLTPSSVYNVGNYNSGVFNLLTNKALTARGSERSQLYITASRVALNDVAWSMIGQQTTDWRWKSNIKGMTVWTSTNNPEPVNFDWTKVDVQ